MSSGERAVLISPAPTESRDTGSSPDAPFLPSVQATCAQMYPRQGQGESGWQIRLTGSGPAAWIWARRRIDFIPDQGWKLHLSATILSAPEVLNRALAVLLKEDAAFKVVTTPRMIGNLNSGLSGVSQVGKFITVYPNGDEQAVRLATALHEATEGLRGPVVPSDRPLLPGSLVHYRYGAFLNISIQDLSGDTRLAIRVPDGELIADERQSVYKPPDWVSDPFVAAGVSTPPSVQNPMIGGRYLLLSTMFESPRGRVHDAIDIVGQRRCVLKRAFRDGAMGLDGSDAWDRLRNEATALARVAPDPRFPQVYGVLEQDGELFLAMEDIEGEVLFHHVRSNASQGRSIPTLQVVSWGRELASMLGAIHDKGLIYRDLKSTNVIVSPNGELRMIDFDVAMDQASPRPLYSPGTYGYMTREQQEDEPPRVAHDVYALGALLLFIVTGAEPSMFPHHFDLLKRPLAIMNPALPPSLLDVITRCLEPNPTKRFAIMEDVVSALAAVENDKRQEADGRRPTAGGRRQRSEDSPDNSKFNAAEGSREHYGQLARRLVDTLCEVAMQGRMSHGHMWAGALGSEHGFVPRDISVGAAGSVLALAELTSELGDDRSRKVLAEAANELALTQPPQRKPLPGLYVGESGVGAALLRAGQVLGDANLIAEAVLKGQLVANLPHASPALFNGTAGRLRYHLLLWDETGAPEHLQAAKDAGERLLVCAEAIGDEGMGWTMPPGYNQHSGRAYLGYSLGAAGIGDALFDLFEATGDERFLEGAQGAGRWIVGAARPALDSGSGQDWPPVEGESLAGAFWGHGASGIGRFLIHAARLAALPGASELARRAALTAAHGARWAGPTLGYGLCGPIEFLLDMFQWRHDETYLGDANTLARLLESFAVERDGLLMWPSEHPFVFTASYMAGYAGVALTLLRLSAPERLPHPLKRYALTARVQR